MTVMPNADRRGAMARGYKLHAITSSSVLHWTLTGMNCNDQTAAHDLLARLSQEGYVIGDNADANPVHVSNSGGCTLVDCSAT